MCSGEEGPGEGSQLQVQLLAPGASRGPTLTCGTLLAVTARWFHQGWSCGLCTWLLSQHNPFTSLQLQPHRGVLSLPSSLPARLHLTMARGFFCFFPSKPTSLFQQRCHLQRLEAILLEGGISVQSIAEFTTAPLFPNLCSGTWFDPNLCIFTLWKESQTKLCWTSYSFL